MQDLAGDYLNPIFRLLNYNLFALGDAKITPLSIIYLILLSAALIYISRKLKNLLITRLLQRTSLDTGAQQAIGTITRYLVLFIGFLIILQTVGINLTTLNVLAGAVGIGIGLGLQNIANNFISGLIILFERPIKVGDRIEVAKVHGQVTAIGARSTRIKTNDNISIIVPNSKFISENVTIGAFMEILFDSVFRSVLHMILISNLYRDCLSRLRKKATILSRSRRHLFGLSNSVKTRCISSCELGAVLGFTGRGY